MFDSCIASYHHSKPCRTTNQLQVFGSFSLLQQPHISGLGSTRNREPVLCSSRPRSLKSDPLQDILQIRYKVYIYALAPWYGPPDPGPRHNVPPLGYSRLLAFHICLLFPHLIEFLANTMQFNTTCKGYDSMSQHSHQSTSTTGLQGGRGANHDHAQGAGGGGATLQHIYNISHWKASKVPSLSFQARFVKCPHKGSAHFGDFDGRRQAQGLRATAPAPSRHHGSNAMQLRQPLCLFFCFFCRIPLAFGFAK